MSAPPILPMYKANSLAKKSKIANAPPSNFAIMCVISLIFVGFFISTYTAFTFLQNHMEVK